MKIKTSIFDKKFDAGEDLTPYIKRSARRRPGLEKRRISMNFPDWMIRSLDNEAKKLGIARQALIKVVVAKHLENTQAQSNKWPRLR